MDSNTDAIRTLSGRNGDDMEKTVCIIRTPRGTFPLVDETMEQANARGYFYFHTSEDGKYIIVADGTRAHAIAK